jgi:hypothetical protein
MTDKTRDKLLISLAILVHDLADKSPDALCSLQEDKDSLWMAITKATAEHHKDEREATWNKDHICGNCDRHSLGAGPADEGYIYCEAKKAVFPKEASCSIWVPERPKTSTRKKQQEAHE